MHNIFSKDSLSNMEFTIYYTDKFMIYHAL